MPCWRERLGCVRRKFRKCHSALQALPQRPLPRLLHKLLHQTHRQTWHAHGVLLAAACPQCQAGVTCRDAVTRDCRRSSDAQLPHLHSVSMHEEARETLHEQQCSLAAPCLQQVRAQAPVEGESHLQQKRVQRAWRLALHPAQEATQHIQTRQPTAHLAMPAALCRLRHQCNVQRQLALAGAGGQLRHIGGRAGSGNCTAPIVSCASVPPRALAGRRSGAVATAGLGGQGPLLSWL